MGLTELACYYVGLFGVAHDRDQGWAVVKTVIKLSVLQKAREF
jgi:hypothetical protein